MVWSDLFSSTPNYFAFINETLPKVNIAHLKTLVDIFSDKLLSNTCDPFGAMSLLQNWPEDMNPLSACV